MTHHMQLQGKPLGGFLRAGSGKQRGPKQCGGAVKSHWWGGFVWENLPLELKMDLQRSLDVPQSLWGALKPRRGLGAALLSHSQDSLPEGSGTLCSVFIKIGINTGTGLEHLLEVANKCLAGSFYLHINSWNLCKLPGILSSSKGFQLPHFQCWDEESGEKERSISIQTPSSHLQIWKRCCVASTGREVEFPSLKL